MIPDDWDAIFIADLFTFKNGLNKGKQFFGYGTPIVNYMDVFSSSMLRTETIDGLVDVSFNELNLYQVCKGDVFFTRTSETVEEIGIAAVMLEEPKNTVYSGFLLRARPIDDSLDDMFKAYCFAPYYFRQQIRARASYTTRALTNGPSLSASLLIRPPLPEQRAIAAALSDVDKLLTKLDSLITKKIYLKQATMNQLLTGQIRLPKHNGEWVVKRLGEQITKFQKTSRQSATGKTEGKYPFFTNSTKPYDKYLDEYDFNVEAIIANTGGAAHFNYFKGPFAAMADCMVFETQLVTRFIYFLLKLMEQKINDTGFSGSGIKHLDKSYFFNIELYLPSTLGEQEAIANILSDMDDQIAAIEARRRKTLNIKLAMMQELLTGKTRLVKPEATHA